MIDFLMISTRSSKRGVIEIYPKFIIKKSNDLMIRGGDFYAIWIEENGLWSTDEQDALQLIDSELDKYAEENKSRFESDRIKVLHMWDSESGMIDHWHKYCQKQMRDSYHMLDEKLLFSNSKTNKKDYSSHRLTYPLSEGSIEAYDKLMSTLYSDAERHKIEWAIGSIVSGDSKKIQKFMVLYGSAGTGKSTILNLIEKLFDGYCASFDAKALGSANSAFALEPFKTNPLVAIQHDGDLSRIEDNTRLNSLVSHEKMTVNEKHKSLYTSDFKCFLFVGTNKPVKITDAKSGLIRRLIDVSPTGNKIPIKEYNTIMSLLPFELGAIAKHCMSIYLDDPHYYDDYIPTAMLGASNDFYNFVLDSYFVFNNEPYVTLKTAWEMYKTYCTDANVGYMLPRRAFQEELKNYFDDFKERYATSEKRERSCYIGFKADKFESKQGTGEKTEQKGWLVFEDADGEHRYWFDETCGDCLAQYASSNETPLQKWTNVKTCLSELDPFQLHYVKVPENHIVIDFDIPDEQGNKCLERNLEAASKWPKTYAELSKSGNGIHLHYIYEGDVSKLSRVFDDHIEVKVFTGNSSLRRKLTKCNDIPIATINSNLPLKGENKMVNFETIKSEKALRTLIKRNLNKEIHPGTKPSIDFIYKILEDAHNSTMSYDVTDMRNAILAFAANSTNKADYCIKLVNKMEFKSKDSSIPVDSQDDRLVFYDIEVFPNLFLVNWKYEGTAEGIVRMINPSPAEIEDLIRHRLVGFNCRRYDNHILYARLMGYNNAQLYARSQMIINGSANCFFGEAYNISYTDIYDFASAGNKKSLKKLEIEMGIHHQELGLPWDQPVPEELWPKVAEYCDNDVIATEAAFYHLSADWTARQILADLAGMTVNDTTNSLTTRIIFGKERKPQGEFNYRDMSKPVLELTKKEDEFLQESCQEMMDWWSKNTDSKLPFFNGYSYAFGKSMYRNEEVGEGGYVYAEPGIHYNIALLDVASMHPHSLIAEVLFGVAYTKIFQDIVEGRVSIKHEDWNEVKTILNGKLAPYIQRVLDGEMTSKDLANALKTAINSVYGLTAATFDNPFRDPRNIDNIVAKRGALFMLDLKYAVQEKGFTVAHIKTDSIKIPNATPEIIQFVMDFGRRYGYTFEHEATYSKMCLVNDAVYIAKYEDSDNCEKMYGYIPDDNKKKSGKWTATGTQFQIPYVFKTLFSKESIEFDDLCETKSVTSSLYLDMNESLEQLSKEETRELDKLGKEFKNVEDTSLYSSRYVELKDKELKTHDYHFVGRVGQFCPIKSGCGGGLLVREKDGKYYAATGSKGYRWMESEMVKALHMENDIDKGYHNALVDAAVDTISQYGDFEQFIS